MSKLDARAKCLPSPSPEQQVCILSILGSTNRPEFRLWWKLAGTGVGRATGLLRFFVCPKVPTFLWITAQCIPSAVRERIMPGAGIEPATFRLQLKRPNPSTIPTLPLISFVLSKRSNNLPPLHIKIGINFLLPIGWIYTVLQFYTNTVRVGGVTISVVSGNNVRLACPNCLTTFIAFPPPTIYISSLQVFKTFYSLIMCWWFTLSPYTQLLLIYWGPKDVHDWWPYPNLFRRCYSTFNIW